MLKRTFDAGQGFRAVLQTNRVAIFDLETNKAAKVSTRVRDDHEWHVATWDADQQLAVLVRGPRGWLPTEADMQAARARGGIPAAVRAAGSIRRRHLPEEVQAAAMDYLTRHFDGYGYKTETWPIRTSATTSRCRTRRARPCSSSRSRASLQEQASFQLTQEERACAERGDPWRLAVVTDAPGPTAQHKLYKPAEIDKAPGLEPLLE